jgi:hypothetical protein
MKIIELDFGIFEFHPDMVIATMNEGVHFDRCCNEVLKSAVAQFYESTCKLGYITLRKNSYSVDPMVHLDNIDHPNLVSIGVVENSPLQWSSVPIESKFFRPGKLESFTSKDDAMVWTRNQILKLSNNSPLTTIHLN